jgi:hypothetical protein
MPELTFRLIIDNGAARATLTDTGNAAKSTKNEVEKPVTLKVQAENALATIRDLKIAFEGVAQIVSSVSGKLNELLDKAGYQERAERKVAQAVMQTGEAAGLSAQELFKMAAQLQEVTNFGDEETLNKAIAQLLTFTNIQGEQFKGAVVAATNLATVLDGDLQSAAIQLGKALNDPTEGLTALTRSGVSFSQAEQDMIKAMWETGQKAEAQQKILESINQQYGGQAEAVTSLRTQVRNLHGDVQESLGGMLKTLINPILTGLKGMYEWFLKLSPQWKSIVAGLVSVGPVVATVATMITVLRTAVLALNAALAANPVALVIAGFAALITIILSAVSAMGGWSNAWALFKESAVAVLGIVWSYIKGFGEFLIDFTSGMAQVLTLPYQVMYRTAVEVFSKIASVMKKLVTGDFAGVWAEIKAGMTTGFTDTINSTVGAFRAAFDSFDGLGAKAQAAWEAVGVTARESAEAARQAAKPNLNPKLPGKTGGNAGDDTAENEKERLTKLDEYYNTLKFKADGYVEYMTAKYRSERDAFITATNDKEKAEALYNDKIAQLSQEREEYVRNELKAHQSSVAEFDKIAEEDERKRQEEVEAERNRQQQIADTKVDFENRGLELSGNSYQVEMNAIDRYYERKHDKLREAGYTDAEITEQAESAKQAIRDSYNKRALNSLANSLGTMGNAVKSYGKSGFMAWKAMATAQAVVDTYSSATAAYKAVAGIPIIGPALAVAAAAAAIASGIANINAISKAKYEPAKAAKGGLTGLLIGKSHAQGGTLIEAEGDEYIIAKDRVRLVGQRVLDFLNFGPVHQVRAAMADIPSMTVPVVSRSYYADGGSVFTGQGSSILEEIRDSIRAMNRNLVNLDTGTTVTVETADPDTRIRRDTIRRDRLTARGEQYDPSL